jgi:hypothetical protein
LIQMTITGFTNVDAMRGEIGWKLDTVSFALSSAAGAKLLSPARERWVRLEKGKAPQGATLTIAASCKEESWKLSKPLST